MEIITNRLVLRPATVELARAELYDQSEFARLLSARVPASWPPETLADALPLFLSWLEAAPEQVGWFGWYGLELAADESQPTLVGSCGFLGPPAEGTVQIGYSVLPEFQRRGFATEMVNGIAAWAAAHAEVSRLVAETEWANPGSVRVLEKVGFVADGSAAEPGGQRFHLVVNA
ncbi:GNAT family N-acetyltransferase [Lacipirellula sp.]|uniref:GNAT family N-acetyltransferase n=1 Tax=Lacipirellula sp. TaxID=2691419 RepID=UPI003D14D55C